MCQFEKSDFKKQLITFDSEEEKPEYPPSQTIYSYRYDKTLNEDVIDDGVADSPKNSDKPKSLPAKGELSKVIN